MSGENFSCNVGIIGIKGLPASYGGFEMLAENLLKSLPSYNWTLISYESNENSYVTNWLKVPFWSPGLGSIFYDLYSFYLAYRNGVKNILWLGPAAGLFLPLFSLLGFRVIVHHGGFKEWKRTKYNIVAKVVIFLNHWIAFKFSILNISDNIPLSIFFTKSWSKRPVVTIEYGGDNAKVQSLPAASEYLDILEIKNYGFNLCVGRAQVDNDFERVIKAHIKVGQRLVILSNWNISNYGDRLLKKYADHDLIHLIGPIYDKNILFELRSNCSIYVHSHTYCGSAPSLIEAMHVCQSIIAYDNPQNRALLGDAAYYSTLNELSEKLCRNNLEFSGRKIFWKEIAEKYDKVFSEVFL